MLTQRPAPVYWAQEGIWFEEQASQLGPAYVDMHRFRITGPLDRAALGEAFRRAVGRHPALRARFAWRNDRLEQVISDRPLGEPLEDVAAEDGLTWRPVPLTDGPLLQARIWSLGPADHVLWIGIHHIVSDGHSLSVLLGDIGRAYAGVLDGAPPEPAGDDGYLAFCEEFAAGRPAGDQQAAIAGAVRRFAGIQPLDFGMGAPESPPEFTGDLYERPLPEPGRDELRALARRFRLTPFMLDLAVWAIVLCRYTGRDNFVVGTSVSCRGASRYGGAVGLMVNTVPIHIDLRGRRTWDQAMAVARTGAMTCLRESTTPFNHIAAEANRAGLLMPLAPVMVGPYAVSEALTLRGVTVAEEPAKVTASPMRLDVAIDVSGPRVRLRFTYARRHLDRAALDHMTASCAAILSDLRDAGPDALLRDLGRRRDNTRPVPSRAPAGHPGRPSRDPGITGARPDPSARSAELADRVARAAPVGALVAVAAADPDDLVTAIWAVWRAGRRCLLLSPVDRPERLAWIVDTLDVPAVVLGEVDPAILAGFEGHLIPVAGPVDPEACQRAVFPPAGYGELAVVSEALAWEEDDPVILVDPECFAGLQRDVMASGADLAAMICRLPALIHLAAARAFAPGDARDAGPGSSRGPVATGGPARVGTGYQDRESGGLVFPEGGVATDGRLAIMADGDTLVGEGEVGELVLHGRPLAAGYLGDPRRTAVTFTPDPRGGGGRILRTGLQARLWGGRIRLLRPPG
jgi:hypothetical protein